MDGQLTTWLPSGDIKANSQQVTSFQIQEQGIYRFKETVDGDYIYSNLPFVFRWKER